ncbi:MAG: hypothetical protein J7466_15100 [Roseiflexus sp.]|nr:hypothetical protein [Roseiflexus sp.]
MRFSNAAIIAQIRSGCSAPLQPGMTAPGIAVISPPPFWMATTGAQVIGSPGATRHACGSAALQ